MKVLGREIVELVNVLERKRRLERSVVVCGLWIVDQDKERIGTIDALLEWFAYRGFGKI